MFDYVLDRNKQIMTVYNKLSHIVEREIPNVTNRKQAEKIFKKVSTELEGDYYWSNEYWA